MLSHDYAYDPVSGRYLSYIELIELIQFAPLLKNKTSFKKNKRPFDNPCPTTQVQKK